MDNFDNFFDDGGNTQRNGGYTPVYHTPDRYPDPAPKKSNAPLIIAIVVAVIMCLVVIINVVVLAAMQKTIAAEYAAKMAEELRNAYSDAIKDSINDKDVIDDIIAGAGDAAEEQLTNAIGVRAREYAPSVAVIKCNSSSINGTVTGSGFLITDSSAGSYERYIVTNAHVVRYEKPIYGLTQKYQWAGHDRITCSFLGDDTTYTLEAVIWGGYEGDHLNNAENSYPDLAICKIVGTQPDNTAHPSLPIAISDKDIKMGDEVALLGNPAGYGLSMSTGIIANEARTITSFGAGKFIMTTAAVNPGNSGGPMINKNGVVLGVVESKLVDENIESMGFALSAGTLIDFIELSIEKEGITIDYTTKVAL